MANKIIIRTAGTDPRTTRWLQPDGTWGISSTAKEFKSFKLAELDPMVVSGDGYAVSVKVADVAVSTKTYRTNHGAEPRGRGSWGFIMGAEDYETVDDARLWWAQGSMVYTEAKKLAVLEARRRGVTLVGVAS